MEGLGGNSFLFMLLTIVLLIIMGQLLEGLPAVLIFAPLLLPIAINFGIDPVQYAMVLIISMGIGSFAPPAGVGFYVAARRVAKRWREAFKHFWPYLSRCSPGFWCLGGSPLVQHAPPALAGLIPF